VAVQEFLVHQLGVALRALAGGGVGFGLGGPLGQKAQRFFGRQSQVLLDEAEVLLRMLLDAVQAGFQVLAPRLEFVVGEASLGEGRGPCGLGGHVGPVVEDVLHQDPFSESFFVFCNRGRDKLKILLWQRNGFWLWYRRLERERFRWPQSDAAALEVSARELRWLLDGLDIRQVKGHRKADFRLL